MSWKLDSSLATLYSDYFTCRVTKQILSGGSPLREPAKLHFSMANNCHHATAPSLYLKIKKEEEKQVAQCNKYITSHTHQGGILKIPKLSVLDGAW